jgi:hypothetical protein
MKYGNDPSMGHKSASPGAPKGGGSNKGASTKLHKASAGGAPGSVGTMGKVSNKNPFPNGMC